MPALLTTSAYANPSRLDLHLPFLDLWNRNILKPQITLAMEADCLHGVAARWSGAVRFLRCHD